jgi:hypothetical protein
LAFNQELKNIYWICHYHRRNTSVDIFQAEIFFLVRNFRLQNHQKLFFLPTDLVMELGITDERKADGRFPLMILSVKKLPTNSESQIDRIFSSVKL